MKNRPKKSYSPLAFAKTERFTIPFAKLQAVLGSGSRSKEAYFVRVDSSTTTQ